MSIYSLVKPSKGSNITGNELFETLIKDGEMTYGNVERWKFIRQSIIEVSYNKTNMPPPATESTEDAEIFEFLIGYIAKKAVSYIKPLCLSCKCTLTRDDSDANAPESLIDLKNYYDALYYPSLTLIELTAILEDTITEEVGQDPKIQPNTFFNIAYKLEDLPGLPRVGCAEHWEDVTAYVIQFYLVLRMHFMCKIVNAKIKNIRKAIELRKMGKL